MSNIAYTYFDKSNLIMSLYYVNKNSLRKRPQKLALKSPQKEAIIFIVYLIKYFEIFLFL